MIEVWIDCNAKHTFFCDFYDIKSFDDIKNYAKDMWTLKVSFELVTYVCVPFNKDYRLIGKDTSFDTVLHSSYPNGKSF